MKFFDILRPRKKSMLLLPFFGTCFKKILVLNQFVKKGLIYTVVQFIFLLIKKKITLLSTFPVNIENSNTNIEAPTLKKSFDKSRRRGW